MICRNCGTQCTDGTLYCINCGAPLQAAPVYNAPAMQPSHGLALTSMIMGIISFLPIFPVLSSILAICFGVTAKGNGNREGMATAGIVCGIISLALFVLMIVAIIVLAFMFAGEVVEEGIHNRYI